MRTIHLFTVTLLLVSGCSGSSEPKVHRLHVNGSCWHTSGAIDLDTCGTVDTVFVWGENCIRLQSDPGGWAEARIDKGPWENTGGTLNCAVLCLDHVVQCH